MVAALFLAMFSHEHGLDHEVIDTHVTVFGNKSGNSQDGEFVRHIHVTVFRNQNGNGLPFDSECPPAAGSSTPFTFLRTRKITSALIRP